MNLFINDIPLCIVNNKKLGTTHGFSLVVGLGQSINPNLLIDNVLFINPTFKIIDELLNLMSGNAFSRLTMITISCASKKKVTEYLKSKFTIIEAGGGIVEKDGEYLMIHRKGQWDIPKRKMEKGETPKLCAGREVEEETGVKVRVNKKIGTIWHTYMHKKEGILKKTHWYEMTCLNDADMKPQMEENILEVRWMTMQQMQEALVDSYRSLRYLVHRYQQDS